MKNRYLTRNVLFLTTAVLIGGCGSNSYVDLATSKKEYEVLEPARVTINHSGEYLLTINGKSITPKSLNLGDIGINAISNEAQTQLIISKRSPGTIALAARPKDLEELTQIKKLDLSFKEGDTFDDERYLTPKEARAFVEETVREPMVDYISRKAGGIWDYIGKTVKSFVGTNSSPKRRNDSTKDGLNLTTNYDELKKRLDTKRDLMRKSKKPEESMGRKGFFENLNSKMDMERERMRGK